MQVMQRRTQGGSQSGFQGGTVLLLGQTAVGPGQIRPISHNVVPALLERPAPAQQTRVGRTKLS